jgi:hypothetical protein
MALCCYGEQIASYTLLLVFYNHLAVNTALWT